MRQEIVEDTDVLLYRRVGYCINPLWVDLYSDLINLGSSRSPF